MYDKIVKIAEIELSQLKYFPGTTIGYVASFCAHVFAKAKVEKVNPIPNEYFDAIKMAICNEFYGGCEPEFETETAWNTWNNLNNEILYYGIESSGSGYNRERSPYQDKTIPFLKIHYDKLNDKRINKD